MIEVVTPENYGQHRARLDAMHRLRYEVFHERLKWRVNSKNGRERDEFDDLSPIYLLAGGDQVSGTWRLLPTTGPYMLNTVFSVLMEDEPAPCDPRVWETSRFAVSSELQGEDGLAAVNRITGELFCGLVEFCLTRGIREIVTAYDIRIARLLPRVGCTPTWRSGRHRICDTIALAGRFDISEEQLEKIRRATGICGSVLHSTIAATEKHAA